MSDLFKSLLEIGRRVVVAAAKNRERSSSSASRSTASDDATATRSPAQTLPTLRDQHLAGGYRDPLSLLSAHDAARLLGRPVRNPSAHAEEEYLSCHYATVENQSIYITLSVSAGMPWDYIRDEVAVGFPSAPFGDEAFIVDDSIYVRRGETIFWVSGRGIDDPLRNRVVEHVLSKLE
ncbi:MAG: hypothetical protein ABGZ35_02650 [Planctomycetaceae bacterium]|jgi:hypothetical protein